MFENNLPIKDIKSKSNIVHFALNLIITTIQIFILLTYKNKVESFIALDAKYQDHILNLEVLSWELRLIRLARR